MSYNETTQLEFSDDLLQRVKVFIDKYYDQKITLDDISDHVNVNKYSVLKAFKRKYKITPYQYVLKQRTLKAKNLIKQNMPLGEIAMLCGFCDQSNMIKNFKKFYKYTPSYFKVR